jgi:hypothetical protein
VTDCRIGWDTAKAAKAAQPDSGRVGDEAVEERAREMYEAYRFDNKYSRMYSWRDQPYEPAKQHWRDKARAALAAQGQPDSGRVDDAMVEAAFKAWDAAYADNSRDAIRKAVEAALAAQGQPDSGRVGNKDRLIAGRWHHGKGTLCCGSFRVAREDWEAGVCAADGMREQVFDWIVDRLNATALAARGKITHDSAPVACESRGDVGVGVDTTTEGSHVCVRIGSAVVYSQFHPAPAASPVPDGWKLAMFVLQSGMYAKLPEEERAVCDALVAENPYIAAAPSAPEGDVEVSRG